MSRKLMERNAPVVSEGSLAPIRLGGLFERYTLYSFIVLTQYGYIL